MILCMLAFTFVLKFGFIWLIMIQAQTFYFESLIKRFHSNLTLTQNYKPSDFYSACQNYMQTDLLAIQ